MSRRQAAVAATAPPPPPPSPPPSERATLAEQTLVVDAGAYTIKAGFAAAGADCLVVPNCVAKSRDNRVYVGAQLAECVDFGEMAFRRPVQNGFIVNWPAEACVWEHTFLRDGAALHCDPRATNLVITEHANPPHALQANLDEMVFEQFEFAACYRALGPALNAYADVAALFSDPVSPPAAAAAAAAADTPLRPAECLLVVDSGHSHTTVTPLIHGRPIHPAVRRLNVGGKHLTNYLAELISLRHFSLMDEPYTTAQIKEDCCFVSSDFAADLDATWKAGKRDRHSRSRSCSRSRSRSRSPIVVDYVLPDYDRLHRGFTRPHDASHAAKMDRLGLRQPAADDPLLAAREEVFPLANERFVVPELLFNPGDIGIPESGIPDTVMQSLAAVPDALWQPLLGNVLLVGGNTLLPGFVERVEAGLRMLAPAECVVRVRRAEDPIKSTWQGGARLAGDRDELGKLLVSRQDYLEHGPAWVARQFATRKVT
ncbi:hypothetical protein MBLNU459_g2137t1 [Dothideomycetes sp. NU459]